jgi:hypothetical protein
MARELPYKGLSMDMKVFVNYRRQSSEPPKKNKYSLEQIFTDLCQSLGIDPVEFKQDGRSYKEIAMAKKLFCYVSQTMGIYMQSEIADKINIDRCLVAGYKKDDFVYLWERYISTSKIWRNK